MSRFIWKGAHCAETLADVDPVDLMLVPGREIDVPEDHPLVIQWRAAGLLVDAPPSAELATTALAGSNRRTALPAPASEPTETKE